MPGTVGVDFGTCNTVIAVWDDALGRGRVPVIQGVSHPMAYRIAGENHTVHVIPSLISYHNGSVLVGEQVLASGLSEAPHTFRWMKSYIQAQQPLPRRISGASTCELDISERTCAQCPAREEGERLCNFVAARDFVSRVILYAAEFCNLDQDEIIFTVPVEAFEHYTNWISEVCDAAGVMRYRILDEPTACVLGYERPVRSKQVFAVFDFGGGTVDMSIVRIELDKTRGRRCTVLGKAGMPLGGRNITHWLYDDFLRRCEAQHHEVRDLSTQILMEVEAAKERLSFEEDSEISIVDPETARLYAADYRREALQTILMDHGLFARLQQVQEAAVQDARDKGVQESAISQMLLVGGSTLIPAVRMQMQMRWGQRVAYERPFTSVAIGACRPGDVVEGIQHNYAVKYWDPKEARYEFKPLVRRGTPFPSDGPVAEFPVAGVYDGQVDLGVDIYEIADERVSSVDQIAFDEKGRFRVIKGRRTRVIKGRRTDHHYWINREQRTFLRADPPAAKGEHRFDLTFTIDGNKRLLMTAMDIRTREIQFRDFPVVKLK